MCDVYLLNNASPASGMTSSREPLKMWFALRKLPGPDAFSLLVRTLALEPPVG
jgi:hypothetical protein